MLTAFNSKNSSSTGGGSVEHGGRNVLRADVKHKRLVYTLHYGQCCLWARDLACARKRPWAERSWTLQLEVQERCAEGGGGIFLRRRASSAFRCEIVREHR